MTILEKTLAGKIAEDTWWRIKQSWDWGFRLGEETLTDLLVLDFMRFKPSHYRLFQSTKRGESQRGTDLEIRIFSGGNQAAVFTVQAKKLYQSSKPSQSEGYYHLKAKVKSGSFQIDILEEYSREVGAIPLYLLYNYVEWQKVERFWHCCRFPDERQLGCTLTPSWKIRQAISTPRRRSFACLHETRGTLPWRCLFDCPQRHSRRLLPAAHRSLSVFHEAFPPSGDEERYNWVRFEPVDGAWPEWLWSRDDAMLSDEDFERLRDEIAQRRKLRQDSELFITGEAGMPDGPPEEFEPRQLILVKEGGAG